MSCAFTQPLGHRCGCGSEALTFRRPFLLGDLAFGVVIDIGQLSRTDHRRVLNSGHNGNTVQNRV